MAERRFAAAIDQGTTGTRFMIFTHDGRVHATAYEEHRQLYPQPGWVEHDPLEIWEKTQAVIRAALAQGKVPPHHGRDAAGTTVRRGCLRMG